MRAQHSFNRSRRSRTSPRSRVMIAVIALVALALSGIGVATVAGKSAGKPAATKPTSSLYGTSMVMIVGNAQVRMLTPSGKAPTWADVTKVYHVVAAARAATAKYREVKTATHDGYRKTTSTIANAVEYVNARYDTSSRPFNPGTPSALIYKVGAGGAPGLAGVTFTAPSVTPPQALAAIVPASMSGWYQGINRCTVGNTILPKYSSSDCASSGGHFTVSTGWKFDAWIWDSKHALFDEAASTGMPGMSAAGASGRKPTIMHEGALEMQMLPPNGKPITWSDIATIYPELTAAKKANDKYRNVAVAERDGYFTLPVLYVPTQGYHYVKTNFLLGRAGTFDPLKPAVLVYNKVGGKMKLSSLLYLAPRGATPQQLDRLFPGSMVMWHRHINNCATYEKILPYYDRTSCAAHGGRFLPSTPWMVHAWLYEKNVPLFAMDK